MYYIFGTMRNGTVELDESVKWPDGARVRVHLHTGPEYASNPDDDPPTPEEIERWLQQEAAEPPPPPHEAAAAEKAMREYAEWKKGRSPAPLLNGTHVEAPSSQRQS